MNNFDEREIVRQFLQTITAGGIVPRASNFEPMLDGRLHRFPIEGDRGSSKSGGYCVYTDKRPAGWCKDFRHNITVKFCYELSDEQKIEYARQHNNPESRAKSEAERREAERRKAEELKLQKENQQAALSMAINEYLYADLFGTFSHPYLRSRFTDLGIHIEKSTVFNSWDVQTNDEPENYRPNQRFPIAISRGRVRGGLCKEGELIIPMLNIITGNIQSLIHIPAIPNQEGKFLKLNYTGLSIQGAAHILRPKYSEFANTLFVAEGICTCIALLVDLREKFQVYSAGSCGNLAPVCEGLRRKYPKKKIIIVADNDNNNAGKIAAEKCRNAGIADGIRMPEITGHDWYDDLASRVKKGEYRHD